MEWQPSGLRGGGVVMLGLPADGSRSAAFFSPDRRRVAPALDVPLSGSEGSGCLVPWTVPCLHGSYWKRPSTSRPSFAYLMLNCARKTPDIISLYCRTIRCDDLQDLLWPSPPLSLAPVFANGAIGRRLCALCVPWVQASYNCPLCKRMLLSTGDRSSS
jgi:hypothetical protein